MWVAGQGPPVVEGLVEVEFGEGGLVGRVGLDKLDDFLLAHLAEEVEVPDQFGDEHLVGLGESGERVGVQPAGGESDGGCDWQVLFDRFVLDWVHINIYTIL